MIEITKDLERPEHRRFCRIDDEVILHFRQVRGGEGGPLDPALEASEHFVLFSRLAEQRERVRGLLRDLRSESPTVSRCIAALEERIGLVETALLLDQFGGCSELRRPVKLSAGGISFRTGMSYSTDTVLLLEMILLPTLTGIVSHGRVVWSHRRLGREGGPPYLTSIEFTDIKESTRDLIARHVLARQSHGLRRGKAPTA
jgi:PilZ domain